MKKEDRLSPIKDLREKIGVSQRQLADALGVHHSYIANLESNLINIEEEDEEAKNKIREIFEMIAEWSGEDAEELIQKQNKATMESVETVKERVRKDILEFVETIIGSRSLSEEEAKYFMDLGFWEKFREEVKSPVAVIRDGAGITQRHLAQAADVSQAFIARLERGELALSGPNTGLKLLDFIIEAMGVTDIDDPSYEVIFEGLIDLQNDFIQRNKERAKEKVKAAFERIKREKG